MDDQEIDLEDFDLVENCVRYQVWMLGYSKENEVTDFECLIDEFDSHKEALKCAQFFSSLENIKLFMDKAHLEIPEEVYYLNILVETAADVDGIDTNINTIYEATVEVN